MTADYTVSLRDRIAKAAREVRIFLGPNSLEMAQRGTPIVLTPGECEELADVVAAVVQAEKADEIRLLATKFWQEFQMEPDCGAAEVQDWIRDYADELDAPSLAPANGKDPQR